MVTCLRTVLKDCKHKERNQRVVIQANYFRGKTLLLSIPPSDPCPPGKYMHMGERGSSAARPQCKPCAPGFFKSTTSKIVTCTAHTKCPPGKHTIASGSATSQPQCEKCATGFYKSITSRSSICAGRLGLFYVYTSLHYCCQKLESYAYFFLFYYSNDFVVVLFLCGRLLINIFLNMLATLNDRDDYQYHNFNGCAQGNSETVHT